MDVVWKPALGNQPGKEGPVRLSQGPAKRPHDLLLEKGKETEKDLAIWRRCLEGSIASTEAEKGEGPGGLKGSVNQKFKI